MTATLGHPILDGLAHLINDHGIAVFAESYSDSETRPIVTGWEWPLLHDAAIALDVYDRQTPDGLFRVWWVQARTRSPRDPSRRGDAYGLAESLTTLLDGARYLVLGGEDVSRITLESQADLDTDDVGRAVRSVNFKVAGAARQRPRLPQERNFAT